VLVRFEENDKNISIRITSTLFKIHTRYLLNISRVTYLIHRQNKPVLRILLRGIPNAHEISVSFHPWVLGQVHCIQHLTPGTLGNATRRVKKYYKHYPLLYSAAPFA
jgi:hypothetical protein